MVSKVSFNFPSPRLLDFLTLSFVFIDILVLSP